MLNSILENAKLGKVPFSGWQDITYSSNKAISKDRAKCKWTLPLVGWTKVNFDGSSKGNIGMARWGGVTRDSQGHGSAGVALTLEIQTNHVIEAMAALQTTKIAKEKGVTKLWLEGDSLNIINYLKGSHHPTWTIDNIIKENISILNTFDDAGASWV